MAFEAQAFLLLCPATMPKDVSATILAFHSPTEETSRAAWDRLGRTICRQQRAMRIWCWRNESFFYAYLSGTGMEFIMWEKFNPFYAPYKKLDLPRVHGAVSMLYNLPTKGCNHDIGHDFRDTLGRSSVTGEEVSEAFHGA